MRPARRPRHLAVSGCRRPPRGSSRDDERLFAAILADVRRTVGALEPGWTLVHGGADGVDIWARDARPEGVEHEEHLPDYATYGRGAPLVRNVYVNTAELYTAWPAQWSRGTWDAIRKRVVAHGREGLTVRLFGGTRVPDDIAAMVARTEGR